MTDPRVPPSRIDVCLVVGGVYHDFDFARRELLQLLSEHDRARVSVRHNWDDVQTLSAADAIISYTCDVRPNEASQAALREWVERGGRWVALHGTNAALDHPRPAGVEAPRCFASFAHTLGSQFIAHPEIGPFTVENASPDHWLVAGIDSFITRDELYLMEHLDPDALEVLLRTHWLGETPSFAESDWNSGSGERLVQYLRPLGNGAVLYNTLGHCRGHYDMAPLQDYYPTIERCSWETAQYYELLRRAIRWAFGATE